MFTAIFPVSIAGKTTVGSENQTAKKQNIDVDVLYGSLVD
jgi:hypothetical protein